MIKETPLKMAARIFESGRITNPEDWDEMANEIDFECYEKNIPDSERLHILTIVKQNWYN